ncbi:MAG: hypothetical protein J7L75_04045 [Thermoproteales archaeon]|nr:hypothetical protein [Thermoproteales archaeon]
MGKETKGVFIRGVDKSLYQEISELARRIGKTVGEVTNEAYRLLLSTGFFLEDVARSFEEGLRGVAVVGPVGELEVTGSDLESYGRRVAFRGIDRLVFRDVSPETFDKYVSRIAFVKELVVPKTLPKMIVLTKCRYVDRIVEE